MDASDRVQAVADGRIDLLCGAATITLTRREIVDFTVPTFADGASVLTPAGASEDFTQLDVKRIGVHAGTTTEAALHTSLKRFGMSAEVVPVGDHAEGLAGVESGTLAAYFGDQSILYALKYASADKDRLLVAGNTLTLELQGLALPLGDHRFRLALDRAGAEPDVPRGPDGGDLDRDLPERQPRRVDPLHPLLRADPALRRLPL